MFRDVIQCEEMLNDLGFRYAKCKCPRDVMQVQMQGVILKVCKMKIMICKMKVRVMFWTW